MILFCDTSALVKLYVQEERSELMLEVAREARVVAVCRIAWVEAMSAFARRNREAPEETPLLNQVRDRFQQDWEFCNGWGYPATSRTSRRVCGDLHTPCL